MEEINFLSIIQFSYLVSYSAVSCDSEYDEIDFSFMKYLICKIPGYRIDSEFKCSIVYVRGQCVLFMYSCICI